VERRNGAPSERREGCIPPVEMMNNTLQRLSPS